MDVLQYHAACCMVPCMYLYRSPWVQYPGTFPPMEGFHKSNSILYLTWFSIAICAVPVRRPHVKRRCTISLPWYCWDSCFIWRLSHVSVPATGTSTREIRCPYWIVTVRQFDFRVRNEIAPAMCWPHRYCAFGVCINLISILVTRVVRYEKIFIKSTWWTYTLAGTYPGTIRTRVRTRVHVLESTHVDWLDIHGGVYREWEL